MKLFFLLSALCAQPTLAHADVIYRCEAPDALSASLRFSEKGRGGRVELDAWKSYPPTALVYGDLLPAAGDMLATGPDRNTGSRVSLRLPAGFIGMDSFTAPAALREGGGRASSVIFRCERF